MEPLFRLVLSRPAVAQREDAPSIDLTQPTDFQKALRKAASSEQGRGAVQATCRAFIATAQFTSDPTSLPFAAELKNARVALVELEAKDPITHDDAVAAIGDAFGKKPDEIVAQKILDATSVSLRDSILAIKYLPEAHKRPIEALTDQLRTMELIRHVAADGSFPESGEALRRYHRRSVKLPDLGKQESCLSTRAEREKADAERRELIKQHRQMVETTRGELNRVQRAIAELGAIKPDQLHMSAQAESGGFMVAENLRSLSVFEVEMRHALRDLTVRTERSNIDAQGRYELLSSLQDSVLESTAISPVRSLLETGIPSFRPEVVAETAFRLKPEAVESLSGETLKTLEARKLSLATTSLDLVVQRLEDESRALLETLGALAGPRVAQAISKVGNTYVSVTSSLYGTMGIDPYERIDHYFLPLDLRVPTTHGSVSPAGIADLLIVKQQLVAYEAADVAHIENVLKGERKEREHVRRRETEELTFTEVEVTTTEERELESTNRFEMSRETEQTIKEDASLKAGLKVTAKYGPFVEVAASVEGSMSRSKEESTKSASSFSQDVTERSARKVTERVLERSSLRVTNEVAEKNSHLLDNTGGGGNIAGVYQWVNKKYQAQMFNYGLRTLYDFMVPEPAAYLIKAMARANAKATELVKPIPFTLRPEQISETNYGYYVSLYGATDVTPPPEVYRTKSFDFNAGDGDSNKDYHHSGQIAIDDGYMAIWGRVGVSWNQWESNGTLDLILGGRSHRFQDGGSWTWSTTLDNQRDSVPFAFETWKWSQLALAGEVKCQRTERAMTKWKLETHAKLTTAYQGMLSDYEEKLAALQMQAGIAIEGQNPEANQVLIREELKKNCITILTEQHFDLFDAIETGSTGSPQIDLYENEAEGPYVRFFEQAFEWEHMTWITYPYFWGRKSEWEARVAFEDPDPAFNEFLKAGYCRVVVPARFGFEGAIDHFMVTGDIWNGGPLPTISNPLYLPIADEIAERLDRPGDEIPQGDPWTVRIPTTLVHLRPDDKLPKWTQDPATGEWVEA
ncbi:MAG: hypothetical protein R2839_03780 [Thermomicrobiales bacterium]